MMITMLTVLNVHINALLAIYLLQIVYLVMDKIGSNGLLIIFNACIKYIKY